MLCLAVEQVLALAPRFRDKPAAVAALHDAIVNEGRFLTRVPLSRDGALEWEERTETVPRPALSVPPAVMDDALLRQVTELPAVRSTLDVDLLVIPSACQDEPGQRPYFPCLPLVVESASGHILMADLLDPHPDLAAVRSKAPAAVLRALVLAGVRPAAIHVRTPVMHALLAETCRALSIELLLQACLPALEDAEEGLADLGA